MDKNASSLRDELARCEVEISSSSAVAFLRAGHRDVEGLLLALSDWSEEKRRIQSELDRREAIR